MAVKGNRLVTLLDVSKSKDKKIGKVAEVLVQTNQMLEDIPYMEMNEGTSHREEIRSGLPAVYYRKANQAIPASKTTTEERVFQAAHVESKSQIDYAVATRGGMEMVGYNRWNQAQGHIQAHANERAYLTIYGSPVNSPLKVPGLADVYASLTGDPLGTSKQVIDGGGVGSNNTSIYRINWGERSIFGVYPKGTQVGLKRTDRSPNGSLVQIQAFDTLGNLGSFWGYEEDFEFDHGLVVKDYRQGARIANIDTTLLRSQNGAADLIDLMISAEYKIQTPTDGMAAWYVNRTIFAFLHKQALNKVGAGAGITYENYQGKPVLTFLGHPVRMMDALLSTEAAVV